MENVKTQKVVTLKFRLSANAADHKQMIAENCNSPKICRWNVATYRVLPEAKKVWVDAGHIKFTLDGWRWVADTPKQIKADLIRLDKWLRLPKAVRANTPPPFDKGSYLVTAIRGKRARVASRKELNKMAERRWARIARGEPDKPRGKQYTFHDRVVGYA